MNLTRECGLLSWDCDVVGWAFTVLWRPCWSCGSLDRCWGVQWGGLWVAETVSLKVTGTLSCLLIVSGSEVNRPCHDLLCSPETQGPSVMAWKAPNSEPKCESFSLCKLIVSAPCYRNRKLTNAKIFTAFTDSNLVMWMFLLMFYGWKTQLLSWRQKSSHLEIACAFHY